MSKGRVLACFAAAFVVASSSALESTCLGAEAQAPSANASWTAWINESCGLGSPPGNGWKQADKFGEEFIKRGFIPHSTVGYGWLHPEAKFYTLGHGKERVEVWQPFDDNSGGGSIGAVILGGLHSLFANESNVTVKMVNAGWGGVVGATICNGTSPCPNVVMIGTTQIASRVAAGNAHTLNSFFADLVKQRGRQLTDDFPKFYFYDFNYNGNWKAVPLLMDIRMLAFNKTTFEQLGLPLPPPHGMSVKDWSWERMGEVACNISQRFGEGEGFRERAEWDEDFKLAMVAAQRVGVPLYSRGSRGKRTCGLRNQRLAKELDGFWTRGLRDRCISSGDGRPYFAGAGPIGSRGLGRSEAFNATLRSPLDTKAPPAQIPLCQWGGDKVYGPGMFVSNGVIVEKGTEEVLLGNLPGSYTFLGGSGLILPQSKGIDSVPWGAEVEERRRAVGWRIIQHLIDPQLPWITQMALVQKIIPPIESALDVFPWTDPLWAPLKSQMRRAVPPQYPMPSLAEFGTIESVKPLRMALVRAAHGVVTMDAALGEACDILEEILRNCNATSGADWQADAKCKGGCPAGQKFMPAEQFECQPCNPGFAQPNRTIQLECNPCDAGRFTASYGATSCLACGPGTFTPKPAALACEPCALGRMSSSEGASDCDMCGYSLFQDRRGQRSCKKCPEGMTTVFPAARSNTSCVCAEGKYLPSDGDRLTCVPCPEGMTCSVGSDARSTSSMPKVKHGYYSLPERPLEAYLCFSPEACLGGPPDSCSPPRWGLTCAKCPEGEGIRGRKSCRGCGFEMPLLMVVSPIFLFLAFAFLYKASNDALVAGAPASMAVGIVWTVGLTFIQTLGLFNKILKSDSVSEDLNILFDVSEAFLIDVASFDTECVPGVGNDAPKRYLVQIIVGIIIPVVALVFFGCGTFLNKMGKVPEVSAAKCFNTALTIFQALFISFVHTVAIPMTCYSHPAHSGGLVRRSVQAFPFVLCDFAAGEFVSLVILMSVFALTFVIPFLVLSLWACLKAPGNTGVQFKMGFRFLFYRFRPEHWYWGLVYSVRQLFLGFCPMLSPNNPEVQGIVVVGILLIYVVSAGVFQPWITPEVNAFDQVSCVVLILVMLLLNYWHQTTQLIGILILVAIGIVAAVFLIGHGLVRSITKGRTTNYSTALTRHANIESLTNNLKQMSSIVDGMADGELSDMLVSMNYYDRRNVAYCLISVAKYLTTRISHGAHEAHHGGATKSGVHHVESGGVGVQRHVAASSSVTTDLFWGAKLKALKQQAELKALNQQAEFKDICQQQAELPTWNSVDSSSRTVAPMPAIKEWEVSEEPEAAEIPSVQVAKMQSMV